LEFCNCITGDANYGVSCKRKPVFTYSYPDFEEWQDSYGAFTYSIREKDTIINYIKNQKEHHKKETFYNEFKRLLIKNGVEFNEKFLL